VVGRKREKLFFRNMLRKTSTLPLIFFLGISFFLFTSTTEASSCNQLNTGDIFKTPYHSAIYLVDSNNGRMYFPNSEIYYTWFDDFSSVQTIDPTCVDNYPTHGGVNYRPGSRLIKSVISPSVYVIEPGNQIRKIASEQVATSLYGSNWASVVRDVDDYFMDNYVKGSPISEAIPHNGQFVKVFGSQSSYYIGNGKRFVLSEQIRQRNIGEIRGISFETMQKVSDAGLFVSPSSAFTNPDQLDVQAVIPVVSIPQTIPEKKVVVVPNASGSNVESTLAQLYGIFVPEKMLALNNCSASSLSKINNNLSAEDEFGGKTYRQFTTQVNNVDVSVFAIDHEGERFSWTIEDEYSWAQDALQVIETSLPILSEKIGPYACEELFVYLYDPRTSTPLGAPGYISYDGIGGYSDFRVFDHELSHSYFFGESGPSWFKEGAADLLGNIIQETIEAAPPSNWTISPRQTNTTIKDLFTNDRSTLPGWGKPLCELEGINDYSTAVNTGEHLLQNIYITIGEEPVLDALSLLYHKYRYTNVELTNEDIYKAFMHYVPQSNSSWLDSLLREKLCL
jgi:hypothetical protein